MATELLKWHKKNENAKIDLYLPEVQRVFYAEYQFLYSRKWRFDYFLPALKLAVEYEGIFSTQSRHTTLKGFSGDTEKYNAAALMGIKVLRYTQLTYTNLVNDLKEI